MRKVTDHFSIVGWKFSPGCYSLIEDGAYCMYCVLFNGGSSGRKIQLVHTPFKTWSDAQRCFRRHSESKTGIHSKSMDDSKEFLKQVSGKKDPVEQQFSKSTVKQFDKNRKVLLSIVDAIKTIGKMDVQLRGHRDDSRYQPDVGEPANHPRVGNFVEFNNFAVRQGNQTLGHHLRTCSSRETCISKTMQNLFLACCYDIMTETIIGRAKEAKFYSVICDEASDASNKDSCRFVLDMSMMMEISVNIF